MAPLKRHLLQGKIGARHQLPAKSSPPIAHGNQDGGGGSDGLNPRWWKGKQRGKGEGEGVKGRGKG